MSDQNGKQPPLLDALSKTVPRGRPEHFQELETRLLTLLDSDEDEELPMIHTTTLPMRPRRAAPVPLTMAAAVLAVFLGVAVLMFARQLPPSDNDTGAAVFQTTLTPTQTMTLSTLAVEATQVPLMTATPIPNGQLLPSAPAACYLVGEGWTVNDLMYRTGITLDQLIDLNPERFAGCKDGGTTCDLNFKAGECLNVHVRPTLVPGMAYLHTVVEGETLWSIVSQYGHRHADAVEAVLQANPDMADANDLQVGELIRIPQPTPTPTPIGFQATMFPTVSSVDTVEPPQPLMMMPTPTPNIEVLIPVVIAVIDLPADHELGSISRIRSIRTVYYPSDLVPEGAFLSEMDVIGRFSTQEIHAYEPITEDNSRAGR